MANSVLKSTLCAAFLAIVAISAHAQQSTVSTLAAEGYEVRGITTFDINPSDDRDEESIFVIMQRDADVYGCALASATSSFCQRIE